MRRALATAAVLATLVAGAAHAQTAQDLKNAVLPATPATQPAPKAGEAKTQPLAAGLAQTSVERRFAQGKATGSLGFLCGRDEDRGGQTAFGDDPHGRFLGARLAFALP